MGKSSSLLAAFHGAFWVAFLGPTRNSESIPSSERLTVERLNDSATKMVAPIKLIIVFLYLYHVGQINVDFKCSYTLDYIAT